MTATGSLDDSLTLLERADIVSRLFRIGNSVLLGSLAVFSVVVSPDGIHTPLLDLSALFASWTCLAGTAYAINDLVDRVRDRVNRPDRYLQRIEHTPPWIIGSVWAVALIALVAGLFVPFEGFLVLEAIWGCCAVGYSFGLKHRSGLLANIVAAGCVATSAAPGLLLASPPAVVSLMSVLFFLMLAREVWKDIEDEPGDVVAGLRTLPSLCGRSFAARAAAVATTLASLMLILTDPFEGTFAFVTLCLGTAGLVASATLFVVPVSLNARHVQRWHRYASIAIFGAFVAGSYFE